MGRSPRTQADPASATGQAPATTQPTSAGRAAEKMVVRALRLRCPNCGRGRLLASWFRLRERCPACGVWLEREEGYFLGAMALNLIIAELLPVGAAALLLVLTWPNPPWTVLQVGVPLGMGLLPLVLFPFARGLWLALDWTVHPPPRERQPDQPRPGRPLEGPVSERPSD